MPIIPADIRAGWADSLDNLGHEVRQRFFSSVTSSAIYTMQKYPCLPGIPLYYARSLHITSSTGA